LDALSCLGVLDLGPKGEVEMVANCILPETKRITIVAGSTISLGLEVHSIECVAFFCTTLQHASNGSCVLIQCFLMGKRADPSLLLLEIITHAALTRVVNE